MWFPTEIDAFLVFPIGPLLVYYCNACWPKCAFLHVDFLSFWSLTFATPVMHKATGSSLIFVFVPQDVSYRSLNVGDSDRAHADWLCESLCAV